MSSDLLFEIATDSGWEDVIRGLSETQQMLRGDLFPDYGAPLRATQHDALGYSNIFATAESTLGESFQVYDGLTNLGLQVDNNGLYGEMPTELTDSVTVGIDLSVGNDAEIGRNLLVDNDAHIMGDLVVDLTSTLTGIVGVGQSPAASVALGVTGKTKLTGDLWVTAKVGIGEDAATDALRVTGLTSVAGNIVPRTDNARDLGTSSLQWAHLYTEGIVADTTTLVVDATNHRVGLGIAAPTVANQFEGVVGMDYHGGAVPTFYLDATNHKVGILTATPDGALDVAGMMRATTYNVPTTGAGAEILYIAGAGGIFETYDRAAGAYLDTFVDGLTTAIRAQGVVCVKVAQAAAAAKVGFLGATPVVRQTGGAATADTTWSAGEVAMLQAAYDCLRTFGLLT